MRSTPNFITSYTYISKYYGRSANGQILYLIRQAIKAFESSEGEITVPEIPEKK